MTLAVGKIVELMLRCGDIDSRFRDASALYKGSAAHRNIQRQGGEHYKREVPLKLETEAQGIPVTIQGRADGIITHNGQITIDEIKSTTLPLDILYRQHPMHLGQAMCYAHMYLRTLDILPEVVGIQLTYYQLDTEELKRHHWQYTPAQLDAFFVDLMQRYGMWLRFETEWKMTRDTSIQALSFPFPAFRAGQREFAAAVYRTITAQKKLYATAPTGIGKTMSTLFPAIKAMGEGKCEKIFYLTAKTITRTVAQEAAVLLAERGLRFKALTLRAKDKICPNGIRNCTPDGCPNARGHYDRVNDALWDMLNNNDAITVPVVIEYAQRFNVCPHEFALDAALWCDLVIGDYNHVFDPGAYLRRFFNEQNEQPYVFLIDEAHNLAERVRDMYSVVLRKNALSAVRKQLKGRDTNTSQLRKTLRSVNAYLSDIRKEDEKNRAVAEYDFVLKALIILLHTAAGEWLHTKKDAVPEYYGEVLDMYFALDMFLAVSEIYDSRFTTLIETNNNDVTFTLFCIDPSLLIAEGLAKAVASVLFSATLSPLPYYRDILGGDDSDATISLPSPFDPTRQRITIHKISTRYTDRAKSYAPIADAIHTAVNAKRGNYLVFFPSYAYLNEVYLHFDAKYPHIRTLVQQSNMLEEDREDYLAQFDAANTETLVGFTVLGGIFSEGIDLKGDRLIGTVIISVGIPMISLRTDTIRNYFDEKNGAGYDYAYTFPGMNKVLQAAGRVIRTETDEGCVTLIDDRFATGKYRALFPAHWVDVGVAR